MGVIIEEIFDEEEAQEVKSIGAEGISQPTTTQKYPSVRDTEMEGNIKDNNSNKEEVSGHCPDKEGEGSRAGDHGPGDDDNDDDWVTVSREDANVDGTANSTDNTIHIEKSGNEEEEDDDDEMMSEEEKRVKIDQAEELKAKGNAHFSAQEYQKAIVRICFTLYSKINEIVNAC